MVKLDQKLREQIHLYLSTQPNLAAVKMKDLRSHLQKTLDISAETLKNQEYKPVVEKFAAEFILSQSQGNSTSQNDSTPTSPMPKEASEKVTNNKEPSGNKKAKESARNKSSDPILNHKRRKVDSSDAASTTAETTITAAPTTEPGDNHILVIKQGKFSLAETELVRSTIHDYCKTNDVDPLTISRYFRSQGVVDKFISSPNKASNSRANSSSTSVREMLQDVEEDEDSSISRQHKVLYQTLQDLLPHRKPPSIRQCVQRILLSDYLPKTKFTEAEEKKLLQLVEEVGRKFTVIGRALGRRPDDCKQALIRLSRKTTGFYTFEEDRKIIQTVLNQHGLNDEPGTVFPTNGISWVNVAKDMDQERTPLDYQRRWRRIVMMNKRYNYPYASNSSEIFLQLQAKARTKKGDSNNNEPVEDSDSDKPKRRTTRKKASHIAGVFDMKERMESLVHLLKSIAATGEMDDKGVNFAALDRKLGTNDALLRWKRLLEDVPESLRSKEFALQEQITFLLTVYGSTLQTKSRTHETGPAGSDTENEDRQLNRQDEKLRELENPGKETENGESESDNSSHGSGGSNSDSDDNSVASISKLQRVRTSVISKRNTLFRKRLQRKVAYFADLYDQGKFKASAPPVARVSSVILSPIRDSSTADKPVGVTSIAASIVSTLRSPDARLQVRAAVTSPSRPRLPKATAATGKTTTPAAEPKNAKKTTTAEPKKTSVASKAKAVATKNKKANVSSSESESESESESDTSSDSSSDSDSDSVSSSGSSSSNSSSSSSSSIESLPPKNRLVASKVSASSKNASAAAAAAAAVPSAAVQSKQAAVSAASKGPVLTASKKPLASEKGAVQKKTVPANREAPSPTAVAPQPRKLDLSSSSDSSSDSDSENSSGSDSESSSDSSGSSESSDDSMQMRKNKPSIDTKNANTSKPQVVSKSAPAVKKPLAMSQMAIVAPATKSLSTGLPAKAAAAATSATLTAKAVASKSTSNKRPLEAESSSDYSSSSSSSSSSFSDTESNSDSDTDSDSDSDADSTSSSSSSDESEVPPRRNFHTKPVVSSSVSAAKTSKAVPANPANKQTLLAPGAPAAAENLKRKVPASSSSGPQTKKLKK